MTRRPQCRSLSPPESACTSIIRQVLWPTTASWTRRCSWCTEWKPRSQSRSTPGCGSQAPPSCVTWSRGPDKKCPLRVNNLQHCLFDGWFVSRITQTLLNETLIDEGSLLRIHPINFSSDQSNRKDPERWGFFPDIFIYFSGNTAWILPYLGGWFLWVSVSVFCVRGFKYGGINTSGDILVTL